MTVMRKEGVNASEYLFGILCVHFIFRLSIFSRDSEDAQALNGLKRFSRFWMQHANTDIQIVTAVDKPES